MKLIFTVILVCFFSSAYANYELTEKVVEYQNDCITKTLDQNNLIRMRFKVEDIKMYRKTLPDDGSLDKFAICMLQKYNVLNDDGSVNENVQTYKLISEDPKKKQEGVKCKKNTGSSNEETARKIFNCFLHTSVYMIGIDRGLNMFRSAEIIGHLGFHPYKSFHSFGLNTNPKPWRPVPFFSYIYRR